MLWLLVLLAVIAGAVINVLISAAISEQHDAQQQSDKHGNLLVIMSKEIDELFNSANENIINVLDLDSVYSDKKSRLNVSSLNKLIDVISDSLHDNNYTYAITLYKYSEEMINLMYSALSWKIEYDTLNAHVSDYGLLERARLSMLKIREKINIDNGQKRIHSALMLKSYENKKMTADKQLAQLIASQHIELSHNRLPENLIDAYNLEKIINQLASEVDSENLVNLKDNQLYPLLKRLQYDLSKLDTEPILSVDLIDQLCISIFGNGYIIDNDNYMIEPGRGGYYTQREEYLELLKSNKQIKNSLKVLMNKIDTESNQLNTNIQQYIRDMESDVRGALSSTWMRVLVLSVFSIIGFLTLTILIINNVRKQLDIMQDLQQKAEAANITKSQFLATISHEIRTPMNGVLGMAEVLSLSHLTEKQHRQVSRIQQSSELLMNLINQVLDFSKIEEGKMLLDFHRFNIGKMLMEMSDMLEERVKEKGIELTTRVLDQDINVKGDSHRLHQILLNLLDNSIKFTKSGSIHVECEVVDKNEEVISLKFIVRDTGVGIASEKLPTIFDTFTQADNSTTREYGGSGLGLSISKKLVELIGGGIEISSTLGIGTEVSFTLQFEMAPDDAGLIEQKGITAH